MARAQGSEHGIDSSSTLLESHSLLLNLEFIFPTLFLRLPYHNDDYYEGAPNPILIMTAMKWFKHGRHAPWCQSATLRVKEPLSPP